MTGIKSLLETLKGVLAEKRHDPTIREFLQAHVHEAFTVAADKLAQLGYLKTDERISLSSAVGDMLETFNKAAAEKCPVSQKQTLPLDVVQKLMER